jgi:hypothetical protein
MSGLSETQGCPRCAVLSQQIRDIIATVRRQYVIPEGPGLAPGEQWFRCRECRKGWTTGGLLSSGEQHHPGCSRDGMVTDLANAHQSQA